MTKPSILRAQTDEQKVDLMIVLDHSRTHKDTLEAMSSFHDPRILDYELAQQSRSFHKRVLPSRDGIDLVQVSPVGDENDFVESLGESSEDEFMHVTSQHDDPFRRTIDECLQAATKSHAYPVVPNDTGCDHRIWIYVFDPNNEPCSFEAAGK